MVLVSVPSHHRCSSCWSVPLPQAVIPHRRPKNAGKERGNSCCVLLSAPALSQLVLTDLRRYGWREFNPQGEDTPIQSDTTHTPKRCNSFLAGEYAESLQTLVPQIPIEDWETSTMPKAISHIKRRFRVCLRNCESYIIGCISSKVLLSVKLWLERSISGIVRSH